MFWSRTGGKIPGATLDETPKPDALAIMHVAKRPQDAGVRRAETAIDLLHRKRRAGIEHLPGTPRRVSRMSNEKLPEVRHKRIIKGHLGRLAALSGKIKPWI